MTTTRYLVEVEEPQWSAEAPGHDRRAMREALGRFAADLLSNDGLARRSR